MIDFNTKFIDQKGDVVKQNYKTSKIVDGEIKEFNDYRETTLEDVARGSLLNSDEEDDPSEILQRYQLFRKIANKGKVNLTEKEKTLLKKYICIKHEVLFAGQALEIIK
jgi:hypothetical protein